LFTVLPLFVVCFSAGHAADLLDFVWFVLLQRLVGERVVPATDGRDSGGTGDGLAVRFASVLRGDVYPAAVHILVVHTPHRVGANVALHAGEVLRAPLTKLPVVHLAGIHHPAFLQRGSDFEPPLLRVLSHQQPSALATLDYQ
jgi:hypothetical protein